MAYWLLKTEPDTFSIDDLEQAPQQTTFWDGVRNYQARNLMRDEFRVGDHALIYHSNAEPPGVVGIARVIVAAEPDPTAFDRRSPYFDPKSRRDEPTWYGVTVQWLETFARKLPLDELRGHAGLEGLELLRKGSRLSVQPVSPPHFALIKKIAKQKRQA